MRTRTADDLEKALAQCEAERIALADAFRTSLETMGMSKVRAALWVQDIINKAAKQAYR